MATLKAAEAALIKKALTYPQATEHHPWGETAIKVKGKVFVFLGWDNGQLGMSCKLPRTGEMALSLPFAEPTGYGLGKSGWVSARFKPGSDAPLPLLFDWLDESYRAVAPAKVLKELGGAAPPAAPKKKNKASVAKRINNA